MAVRGCDIDPGRDQVQRPLMLENAGSSNSWGRQLQHWSKVVGKAVSTSDLQWNQTNPSQSFIAPHCPFDWCSFLYLLGIVVIRVLIKNWYIAN